MTEELNSGSVHVIIPALNEEHSLPGLLAGLEPFTVNTIVVDNGSRDRTGQVARQRNVQVVVEPRRGYGAACLAGLHTLESAPANDIVVFLDADGSDNPAILPELIRHIDEDRADLVLASRTLVPSEPGALTWAQRFGNGLACGIISALWNVRYTDLAPCRALKLGKLRDLHMNDQNFGWTVQMQVRAAKQGYRVSEVPSRYRRRRFDESKISGRFTQGFRAGMIILSVIGRELLGRGRTSKPSADG